jgi:aminoglycoside phosphotransferase (APT) family kinase protein
MIKIPAKERFNLNQNSVFTAPEVLHNTLLQIGRNPDDYQLIKLFGGYMNSNFLAQSQIEQLMLRVYASDIHTAQKEFDLLRFLSTHPVTVPKVFAYLKICSKPVVVMEYLDGITLEDRLQHGDPLGPAFFEALGQELGEVHKINFERARFIGPKLDIGYGCDKFSDFIGHFIQRTLRDLKNRPDKLDLTTNERLWQLFENQWHRVVKSEVRPQLVHCDFNPKNIMISKDTNPRVLGIIDWEFSDSGNGMIDLGNFFRFDYDYPNYARDSFISGYKTRHPNLDPDWVDLAKLIDLGSMCGFLERQEDYQKSFHTARTVIQSTLTHFGG